MFELIKPHLGFSWFVHPLILTMDVFDVSEHLQFPKKTIMKRLCVALQIVRNALELVLENAQYGSNCILSSLGLFVCFPNQRFGYWKI